MKDKADSLRLGVATLLAGALIGVVGGLFLHALELLDDGRVALIDAAAKHSFPGWLAAVIACLAGASLVAWLAQRYAPEAPQLAPSESTGASRSPTSNLSYLTVNFAGAGLAVGAGFAIGPERPAIQMGGAIGRVVGRLVGLSRPDAEILTAATGGAGVATMFNAPLGCAAYTVEAVLKRVDLRISLVALGTGAIAVAVVRVLIGRDVNFLVGQLPDARFAHLFLYLLLGCVIAVFASLNVRTINLVAGLFQRARMPSAVRGALIGAAIGLLAWYSPDLVGTGESLTQDVIDGRFALSALIVMFLIRFFLGPLSLAAGTPGGYFTPVLLLGALIGAAYGTLLGSWLPAADLPPPAAFALAGMAANWP